MKKLLLFSVALLWCYVSFSQNENDYNAEMNRSVSVPNSPEANGFAAYGGIPVDLRVGKPNVSVPLYTYKGKELDLPMSLSYDMDARKVEDASSQVGLGWNLNLGGRISRQVKEKADVYTNNVTGPYTSILNDLTTRQNYLLHRQTMYDHNMTNPQGVEFDSEADAKAYFHFIRDVQLGKIDIGLDSYSVNALGLNDLIKIDFDSITGAVVPFAVKNPRLKVLRIASNTYEEWHITDDSGTIYVFKDAETTENTHADDNSSSHSPIAPVLEYTSSWLLSAIVSPNGKDVYEFTYTDFGMWKDDAVVRTGQYMHTPKTDPTSVYVKEVIPYHNYKIEQQFLTQVKHNGDVIIDIGLKSRDDLENQASALASITVRDPLNTNNNSNVLKHFKFSHTYFGTGSGLDLRLKLDEIEIAGGGFDGTSNYAFESKYSFDYDRASEMPDRNSKDQDRFGFYNDAGNTGKMYPAWTVDGHTFDSPSADRSFNESKAKIGILEKIHYPLGGFAEFVYGRHTDGSTNYDGLRIESITTYTDTNEIAAKKTFSYSGLVKNFDPSFTYKTYNWVYQGGTTSALITYHRTAKAPMGDQPHISYGTVEEKLVGSSNGNYGTTTHTFYNDVTEKAGSVPQLAHPFAADYYDGIRKGQLSSSDVKNDVGTTISGGSNTSVEFTTNYYEEYSVADYPEGKDNYLELYWNTGQTKVLFHYLPGNYYTGVFGHPGPSTGHIDWMLDEPYSRMRPVKSFADIKDIISSASSQTKTLDGNAVTTTSTTTYDATLKYLPKESSTTTSENNETMVSKYTYPEDIPTEAHMADLIAANRIATPVETRSYQKVGTTETLLSTQKTTFDQWGTITPSSSTNVSSVKILLPDAVMAAKGVVDANNPLQTRVEYHSYDSSNGNPREISRTTGAHSSYIWGYDGNFPVAKIENATYAQSTASGLNLNWTIINDPDANGGDAALRSQLDKIRIGLPDAMVTTYTYKPFMGVSSITDPGGNSIYYHYDDENRLKYVENKDGKVLSVNEYNNKN